MGERRRRHEKGFILADVVLGMFILVVALLGIGGLYFQSARAGIFADNRTVAYNWAQERIEYLKGTGSWRGSSTAGTEPAAPADTGMPPRNGFSRTTSVNLAAITALPITTASSRSNLLDAVNKRLIDVVVTVSWTENSIPKSVSLETLIERE